jgi:outer membrane protein insertion porin family
MLRLLAVQICACMAVAGWNLSTFAVEAEADDWAEGKIVQSLELRGLVRVEAETVRKLMHTAKGSPFSGVEWSRDFHRVYDSGLFLNVRTTEPQRMAAGADGTEGVSLLIELTEKAVIKKVAFSGNETLGDLAGLKLLSLHAGDRFDAGTLHRDKLAIERAYKKMGYRDVAVDGQAETISSHRQKIGGNDIEIQDEVQIAFAIKEGPAVRVQTIRFEGNLAFPEWKLSETIETKGGGPLLDDVLEDDKNRLLYFYRAHGYPDAEIADIDTTLSPGVKQKSADIVIHVREGTQYFTGTVTVTGNTSISLEKIQKAIGTCPDAVFSDIQLFGQDHDRIVELYSSRGRIFTTVEMKRTLSTGHLRNAFDVTIDIHESAEITMDDEIISLNNTTVADKIILNALAFKAGDRLDSSKLKSAEQRLKAATREDLIITPVQSTDPAKAKLIISPVEKTDDP